LRKEIVERIKRYEHLVSEAGKAVDRLRREAWAAAPTVFPQLDVSALIEDHIERAAEIEAWVFGRVASQISTLSGYEMVDELAEQLVRDCEVFNLDGSPLLANPIERLDDEASRQILLQLEIAATKQRNNGLDSEGHGDSQHSHLR
jgi:hypothetical protein